MTELKSLQIRRMQEDDPPAMAASFADMNKTQTQYERYWRENMDGRRVTLVGLLDERIVGYTNVIWQSDYEAFRERGIPEINDMNTVTDIRKNGIGTRMLEVAEEVVLQAGKRVIGIGVGVTPDYAIAQSLYPKLGYVSDGTGIHPDRWGGCMYSTKELNGRAESACWGLTQQGNSDCTPPQVRGRIGGEGPGRASRPAERAIELEEEVRQKRMDAKPKCIIVSGRPGSGKTTLAGELSSRLYLPKVSRDEIKEGYVNTFGVKHDQLPDDTNAKVNEMFLETTLNLLKGNVSVVIEAAFQHKVWNLLVPHIQQVAHTFVVICDLDAETSARRHLDRGLNNPYREFFHGDKRVSIFRETGQFAPGAPYDAPHFDVPTLRVSTLDGYAPEIESIIEFTGGMPKKPHAEDARTSPC